MKSFSITKMQNFLNFSLKNRGKYLVLICMVMSNAYADPVTLNLKDTDINTLIQTISQITGKNFVVDPRVKGNVSLVSSHPMEEDEVYQVFLSILSVNNFAAIPAGNVIKIVPAQNAKQEAIPNVDKAETNAGDQRITRVIPVKNVSAAQIVPIIRPLIPPEGHLAAYTPTNVLIIADSSANVERLTEIIEKIDHASDETVELVKLKHASAKVLEKTLNSIGGSASASTGEATAAAQGGLGLSPNSSAKVIADDRSNSLLVSGSPQSRTRMKQLIEKLDKKLPSSNAYVIYLNYAKAKDILPILQGIGGNLTKDGLTQKTEGETGQKGLDASRIHADEATNSIVINADVNQLDEIKSIVASLDVRRAQVMVEAVIAEVSSARSKELGVQWAFGGDGGPYGLLNFTNAGLGAATIAGIATSANPASAAISAGVGKSPIGGMLVGASAGEFRFGALVQALGKDGDTNILSTPSLVTLDNEEAQMVVGQNIPIVTGTFTTNQSGGGSINNPFQTIERQDVGITLKIKPQINKGNSVKLEISQEVSNLVADSQQNTNGPTTNKRTIKTNVIVEDGQVLVLGGLMDDQARDTEQKVPGLSSIPLVGNLFKSRSSDSNKSNLMVFIRPIILRDQLTTNNATAAKYEFIQNAQRKAQLTDTSLLPITKDNNVLPNIQDLKKTDNFLKQSEPESKKVNIENSKANTRSIKKIGVPSFDNPYGGK